MSFKLLGLAICLTLVALVLAEDVYTSRGLPAANWMRKLYLILSLRTTDPLETVGFAENNYEEGLAAAKENGKPIMVLFTQPWCGACKNLKSELNKDHAAFDAAAENLNLVSIEGENIADEQKLFSVDGGYIPRAYFLDAEGKPDYSITGPNPQYKYFFASPQLLVQAMVKAAGIKTTKKDL